MYALIRMIVCEFLFASVVRSGKAINAAEATRYGEECGHTV